MLLAPVAYFADHVETISYSVLGIKSKIAIGSLFNQIQRTKIFFIEVKTITKSPGNGLAETICLSNLEICIKKAEFL